MTDDAEVDDKATSVRSQWKMEEEVNAFALRNLARGDRQTEYLQKSVFCNGQATPVTRPYTYSVATLQVCFKKEVL
jgi:hypothetical protein